MKNKSNIDILVAVFTIIFIVAEIFILYLLFNNSISFFDFIYITTSLCIELFLIYIINSLLFRLGNLEKKLINKKILSDDDLIKDNNYTANKTHNRCLKCGYKITLDDKECPYCKEKVNIDNK